MAEFGTDRPVDRVKLRMLRRYLINVGLEQTLLNDATTYASYTAVPAKLAEGTEQPIQRLKDCNKEQQSFLVYHSTEGVTHSRIVEVFNEHFHAAINAEVLGGLLSALRSEGDELGLLVHAAGSDWKRKYLPKRPPPTAIITETFPVPIKTKTSRPVRNPPAPRARKTRNIKRVFTDEQQHYLAWMTRRVLFQGKVFEGFVAAFGDRFDEQTVHQRFKRLKNNPERVDELLRNVGLYSWLEPDFQPDEDGFMEQGRARRQAAAKQRIRRGINLL